MNKIKKIFRKKWLKVAGIIFLLLSSGFIIYFPGRQGLMAMSIATGVGIPSIQSRIDRLEENAIAKKPFSKDEKVFLTDLYSCLAKGAKLSWVFRQSGQMMDRYLNCSGDSLATAPRIFTTNSRVMDKVAAMRSQILADIKKHSTEKEYQSETFYMPHSSSPDSIFGLYYGRLIARPVGLNDGRVMLYWRAEVPWKWPSYDALYTKYGRYHAENFPLPNIRSIVQGQKYALYLDNGLGEYLEHEGIAKSFNVYAEWTENMKLD